MNVSNFCVLTGRILSLIDWEEVGKIVFHGLIAFAVGIYVAGETLGNWVHSTNDKLTANWVRLIVPPTPAEGQALIIEEVSTPALPATEVEQPLPPAPLAIQDPWDSDPEVELMLPLALEPMAILFTTPMMLTAAQAPVALLAASQEVTQQTPPPATNGRRKRGRRAHQNRTRQIV